MQFTVKTEGHPAKVMSDIRASAKQLRVSKSENAGVASALCDEIARRMASVKENAVVSVSATVTLDIETKDAPEGEPAKGKPRGAEPVAK